MWRSGSMSAVVLCMLTACAMPYRPAVVVEGSAPFPGIARLVAANAGKPVDLVAIHGMCTHTAQWAHESFERITAALDAQDRAPHRAPHRALPASGGIEVIARTGQAAGGTIRYHGLVWSGLTTGLKRQLDYDEGHPTDCAAASVFAPVQGASSHDPVVPAKAGTDAEPACPRPMGSRLRGNDMVRTGGNDTPCAGGKDTLSGAANGVLAGSGDGDACTPVRARLNGRLKSELLNDCIADAVIYAGESGPAIRDAVAAALTEVLARMDAGGSEAPLVIVAESLGGKLVFDALIHLMTSNADPARRQLAQNAARRLALVFMLGNQLPIMGLAEQDIGAASLERARIGDSLQRFLALRRTNPGAVRTDPAHLSIVAFTDPNDVLAYRLLPTRYRAPDVSVADVLVSNTPTWFGLIADPFAAHTEYLDNPEVGRVMARGWP